MDSITGMRIRIKMIISYKGHGRIRKTGSNAMRVMVFRGVEKVFYLTLCCFCKNAAITNQVSCSMDRCPEDDCECFREAVDIKERMNELTMKLPEGYRQCVIPGQPGSSRGCSADFRLGIKSHHGVADERRGEVCHGGGAFLQAGIEPALDDADEPED